MKEVNQLNWYYTLLFVFIILFIIALVIFFTKIYIQISYQHEKDMDELNIKITFWKIISIQKKINLNQLETSNLQQKEWMNEKEEPEEDELTEGFIKKAKKTFRLAQNVIPIVNEFLKKITVHSFEWKTKIGSKDASIAGMLTGALWGVKGGIVGVISQRMKLKELPTLTITPLFHQSTISTSLQCMISFRVGKAIYAIMQLVKYKEKYKLNTAE
jgi:hypothetical protein